MPSYVLILTNNNVLLNLLEQVFIVLGDATVMVSTLKAAEATLEHWALATCKLVIIDTAVLGMEETEQTRVACHLLEDWTTTYAMLPFLFLGTLLQKYALLAIRADIMRFVVKPFSLEELVDAIENVYPRQDLSQFPTRS